MRKLLFIGHAFHKKTGSAAFFVDLLRQAYDVQRFYFDPDRMDAYDQLYELPSKEFDVLVVFQLMPSIERIRKHISFRRGVFVPMYDYYRPIADVQHPIWSEYLGFLVINFCKEVHREVAEAGWESRYIQYYPEPATEFDWGDARSLFFWQRISNINVKTVYEAMRDVPLEHIHLHRAIDPHHVTSAIFDSHAACVRFYERLRVSESSWYGDRKDMLQDVEKSALYFAPRYYEGIGMSFLEAMAMGRCVVAPDGATMTEYITHGQTGLIYDFFGSRKSGRPVTPLKVSTDEIRKMQRNAYETAVAGHKRWEREKAEILKWIDRPPPKVPVGLRIHYKLIAWVPQSIRLGWRRFVDSFTGRCLSWDEAWSLGVGRLRIVRVMSALEASRIRLEILGLPLVEYKLERTGGESQCLASA